MFDLMTSQCFQMLGMLLLLHASTSLACTAIGIGKDASKTGYPMVTHSEDAEPATNDVRLIRVPRKKWPAGSMRPLYYYNWGYPRLVSTEHSPEMAPIGDQQESVPLGYIPQVPETWAYWDTEYGAQNERGLSMGGGTCTSKTAGWPVKRFGQPLEYGYNRAGIEDLTKIGLERCETARCAIETMGKVAMEQGYYEDDAGDPNGPWYSGSSDCLMLADLNELWAFHILTGKDNTSAIWAAQRIPSNHVGIVANAFTIGEMNLSDTENFKYSPGITQLAEEKGWWRREDEASPEVFNFFRAYGYVPKATNPEIVIMAKEQRVTPEVMEERRWNYLAFYSGRRMWRVYNLLSPLEGSKLDPHREHMPTADFFPVSVPAPQASVTPRMVMDAHRDHFEGTPFDMTKGMAAGPFGNPNRASSIPMTVLGQWERPMCKVETNWAFLNEVRPHNRSIMWFALDAPHGSVYLPFYAAATTGAPESYHSHEGTMANFSKKVAWWAYNFVNQYSELNFQAINGEVRKKVNEVEDEAERRIVSWEADADKLIAAKPGEAGETAAMELLTARSNQFAEEVLAQWWKFSEELISKYGRHVVTNSAAIDGVDAQGQQFPEWWLRDPEVGFSTWSPSDPVEAPLLLQRDQNLRGGEAGTLPTIPTVLAGAGTLPTVPTVLVAALITAAAYHVGLRHRRQSRDVDDKAIPALALP